MGFVSQTVVQGIEALRWRQGGRPPYDAVLMLKVLVLQALYNVSDDQAEFQIQDRLSFMRFLGLGLGDKGSDAKTIWLFREHLTQARNAAAMTKTAISIRSTD